MIELHCRRKKNGVPILSMKDMEEYAQVLLSDFDSRTLKEPVPVDMDAFCEFYLKLEMDYQNLSHNQSILGMMVFTDCLIPVYDIKRETVKTIPVNEKTILVDNSLLETDKLSRYRFTLGHEASHWIFHRHQYLVEQEHIHLLCVEDVRSGVRSRMADMDNVNRRKLCTDNDWMEWQADYMASALLMPKQTFHIAAQELLEQAGIDEGYITRGISDDWDMFIQAFTIELAETFQVSLQAARIRCDKLGIVRED